MIKKTIRALVIWLLTIEARLVLRRYQPRLVGVTGNIGKTSVKDAIYAVLARALRAGPQGGLRVRRSAKSFNSEIGVPLSILNQPNAWGRPLDWLRNLAAGLALVIFSHDYPDWLVLEIGADRPGDIKKFVRWLKFDLVVLTSLPDLPVHIEFFSSVEAMVEEKLTLLEAARRGGAVIINGDNERLAAVKKKWSEKLNERSIRFLTYGFGLDNDLCVHHEHIYYDGDRPAGLTFKVDHLGRTVPFRLPGLVGRHQLYAPAAALLVGAILNLNLVEMAEALIFYQPPPGRLRLLPGIKETLILDDSYNASPAAVTEALATLKTLTAKGKKIVVLGDMMELGEKTIAAHRQAGIEAAGAADLIITVGVRAKFIAAAAAEKGFKLENMRHFDEASAVGGGLEHLLAPGDLVLVKGSQSMRMERVVEEIMAEPEKKGELLCRQEPEWQER
ncbi:MAG: UDP-N-acetylmuramoyl-tripeptide--D-alanyl-D-alanine ligase [Candidatus Vogelbacteria bacterium]|nr:UDP-N-acetylmuramoyl-tripeptide--D-alanyl-D-alanine ligase [Candidatus Vogelbacteria bacterium]